MTAVREWCAHNERHRTGSWPDRNTEYFYYQTLVGAWPLDVQRATAYMEKASREAKVHTSWTAPQPEYDAALTRFVERTLADPAFTGSLARFVDTVSEAGRRNSLAQTLLKLTAPGIPDFYQGTELWSFDLVDPDNRRPVDYAARRRLLDAACQATPEAVLARAGEGLPKLWLIRRGLAVRARHSPAFGRGAGGIYEPLAVTGRWADRIVAFSRGGTVATVVPRLARAIEDWSDTAVTLPAGRWRDTLTDDAWDGSVRIARLLARFPVALLERTE
jgi:(1->4)-alpha-D-glucan 1-alpha-D-glucosylmutase